MKTKGFTLIELMIVISILGIVGAILFRACGGVNLGSAEHAQENATKYLNNMGYEFKGVSCTGTDSDGDGYISCDVNLSDGNRLRLDCASGGVMTRTEGCKEKAAVDMRTNNLGTL